MKKTLSVLSLLLVLIMTTSTFAFAASPASAQHQTVQPLTKIQVNGPGIPMRKSIGLPEGKKIHEVFTDIGGDYNTFFCGIDKDKGYDEFLSASKDGRNFITVYPETVTVQGLPDDIVSYSWRSSEEPIYNDGWYYLTMYGKTSNDWSSDGFVFYIKTTDFAGWTYCENENFGITLPKGQYEYSEPELIGDYNGTYIAADVWEDDVYYISADGKNWTEKSFPLISEAEMDSSDPCIQCIWRIQMTNAGVLFYKESWNIVDALTVTTSFSDYVITKDFSNYRKLDLSALGGCKGKFNNEEKTSAIFDNLIFEKAKVDNSVLFYRNYGQIEETENYRIEVKSSTVELYTLDENTLKLIKDSELNNIDSWTYVYFTDNQYVFTTENIDKTSSLYVKNGGAITACDLSGSGFGRMNFIYHVTDKNYPNMLKPDGTADVEYIIGMSNEELLVTFNLFRSVYTVPLPKSEESSQWSLFHHPSDNNSVAYLQKYSGIQYDEQGQQYEDYEYYWVEVEELFNYIKDNSSVMPEFFSVSMYRLYNPNSGEHFYTADVNEKDNLVYVGWKYEGIGWTAPATSDKPVYRLYNQNGGEHHYTLDASERDFLVSLGWKFEDIGWYSADTSGIPLYRQYNPNAFANNHNYTADKSENDWLVSLGWKAEGIGWYGVA